MAKDDVIEVEGKVVDTMPNAMFTVELEGVINIEVNPDCLLERLSGRIIHRKTGETFHKVFNPPVDYKEEDY